MDYKEAYFKIVQNERFVEYLEQKVDYNRYYEYRCEDTILVKGDGGKVDLPEIYKTGTEEGQGYTQDGSHFIWCQLCPTNEARIVEEVNSWDDADLLMEYIVDSIYPHYQEKHAFIATVACKCGTRDADLFIFENKPVWNKVNDAVMWSDGTTTPKTYHRKYDCTVCNTKVIGTVIENV